MGDYSIAKRGCILVDVFRCSVFLVRRITDRLFGFDTYGSFV